MVSKIFRLAAVPAGLALTSYGLYAVSDREPKGSLLHPNQLSIYSAPLKKSKYVEEEPGRLQSGISVVRQTVWPFVTWGQHVGSSIKMSVEDTVQFGKDSYVYLKNPPPEFLPRAGIIAVSGLAGLVLARKGSKLKKILYSAGLTALGVSVCYPTQAVIVAKLTGKKIYNGSHQTYNAISSLWKASPKKDEKPQSEDAKVVPPVTEAANNASLRHSGVEERADSSTAEPESEIQNPLNGEAKKTESNPAAGSLVSTKETKFQPDTNLLDHGQANPEDVDMYSTRS
ncbi:MICOS complex subunit MIC27 [Spea bombifrons]|uniref:MICOS complex subunit MIC27 n=1 Tax=Spea bombifrons TaxID=233779 RepID=UPI00234AC218|nr:MICOS complex subunit MIC27 [Spea bombifrons]